MATNSREARRRKILERGSDRLALITGRIQTLPSSCSSSPDPQTHLEHTTTTTTTTPSPPPPPPVQDQIAELPCDIEQHDSDSTLPRTQSDANTEALRAIDAQVQQLISSLMAQNAPQPPPVQAQRRPLFTASGVSNAIAESERIRVLFSVAVAMLVVLVHMGFPLLGRSSIVKTLLGFRPLYLVLLTNVTFVVARILGKQRGPGEARVSGDGVDWVSKLGRALEIGLVAQKVLDALFMDCAVYAVVVVCGLSFAWLYV